MDKGNKEKVIVPIVCLLLSIVMWFYIVNIENPQTSRTFSSVPVELQNTDKLREQDLAITPGQEFETTLKLSGGVRNVDKIKKDNIKLVADFQEYKFKIGKNSVPVKVVSSPSGVNIDNSSTLFIEVLLEPMMEKEFKIEPRVETEVAGSLVTTESVTPNTVTIYGAKSTIDSIDKVIAYGKEDNLKESIVKRYPIKAINKKGNEVEDISYSLKEVEINIKVAEAIEKEIPVNIKTTGELPNGVKLKSITGNIEKVIIRGAAEEVEKIGYLETEPIDLSNITENKELKILIYEPDEVKIAEGSEYLMVKINVIKNISKEFTVKYNTVSLATDLTIKPNKDTVVVTISGNEDEINAINISSIKVTLDLSTFKEAGTFTSKPSVSVTGLDNNKVSVEDISFTLDKIVEPEQS